MRLEDDQSLADTEEESMNWEKCAEDTALESPDGVFHFGKQ